MEFSTTFVYASARHVTGSWGGAIYFSEQGVFLFFPLSLNAAALSVTQASVGITCRLDEPSCLRSPVVFGSCLRTRHHSNPLGGETFKKKKKRQGNRIWAPLSPREPSCLPSRCFRISRESWLSRHPAVAASGSEVEGRGRGRGAGGTKEPANGSRVQPGAT